MMLAITEAELLPPFIYAWTALALVVAVTLFFVTAPYGRHTRGGWGPRISSTLGWVLMEAPSPILMALFFALGDRQQQPAAIAFFAMWELHYLNRAFIFPFRRRGGQKPMPAAIALQAIFFNCVNAWTCGRWLFSYGPARPAEWLTEPRFVVGAGLFLAGLAINFWSDEILITLRRPGETGYRIPTGGLYRWVSAPNYLGEIIEWWGFAIATWSLAPLGFAVWTTANLLPRAVSNHAWYQQQFPDYPRERRAIVPYLF
jgi:3-oxo-5-alpha-steroid 4-dehydrogenase 1